MLPAKRRGFTLIEILCTVIILAVAAKAAMPLLSGNGEAKLSGVARSTISDLFYAQNLAITTQQPIFVLFSTVNGAVGGGYRVLTQTNSTTYALLELPGGAPFAVNFGQAVAGSVGSQTTGIQVNAVKQGGTAITPLTGLTINRVRNNSDGTVTILNTWTSQSGVLLGFDTMGQPVVGNDAASAAGKLSSTGSIDMAATGTTAIYTLNLEPLSGEITVN